MNRILLGISFLFMMSCQPKPSQQIIKNFDDECWSYGDDVSFEISVADISKSYNLEMIIAHSIDFSHQNIYVQITTKFPNGTEKEEEIPIDLADKTGNWHGDCNSEKCELRIYLLQDFKFKETGSHEVVFEQFSREENLCGISSLDIGLYPQKEK